MPGSGEIMPLEPVFPGETPGVSSSKRLPQLDTAIATPDAGGPLAGSTALVATTSQPELTALGHVLAKLGVRLEMTPAAGEIIDRAKSLRPEAILLDVGLPGLDPARVVRILTRHPQTAAAGMLLVTPASPSERLMQQLGALEVFAILPRPLSVERIRESFTSAVEYSRRSGALLRRRAGGNKPVRLVEGCSSLLFRKLQCPFHEHGVDVNCYSLRSGKVLADTDIFDLPVYRSALPGSDFIDFHVAGLMICPRCLFATIDPDFFDDPQRPVGDISPKKHLLDGPVRGAIEAGAQERKAAMERLVPKPMQMLFTHERSHREALAGYELAIMSSRTLYEASPVRQRLELVRIGNYELRRALLLQQAGEDQVRITAHRRAALAWLSRAFGEIDGAAMYKTAYQLLALHLHLGEDLAGHRYLQALREMTRLSRRDVEDAPALERYYRRGQALWEDRDLHRARVANAAA